MSIISTILGVESRGGHNIPQGQIGDINNQRGTPAQGYFQITDPTWAQFGGLNTGYQSAIQAPYSTQLDVAQNIPVARWGPNTQAQLAAQGYTHLPGETLGQMLNRYGENPADTVAADGSTYSGSGVAAGSGGSIPQGPDQTFTTPDGRTFAYTTDPNAPPSQFDTTGMAGGGVDTTATDGSAGGVGFTQAGTGSGVASGAGAGAASTGSGASASAGATSSSGSSSGGEGKATAVVGVSNTFFGDLNTWISQTLQRFGAAFQTALGASENSIATFFGGIANWFTRGFLIILGAVLIILAIIAMTGRSVTQVLPKGA